VQLVFWSTVCETQNTTCNHKLLTAQPKRKMAANGLKHKQEKQYKEITTNLFINISIFVCRK